VVSRTIVSLTTAAEDAGSPIAIIVNRAQNHERARLLCVPSFAQQGKFCRNCHRIENSRIQTSAGVSTADQPGNEAFDDGLAVEKTKRVLTDPISERRRSRMPVRIVKLQTARQAFQQIMRDASG
jgi:hypothetical protein